MNYSFVTMGKRAEYRSMDAFRWVTVMVRLCVCSVLSAIQREVLYTLVITKRRQRN